MIDVIIKIPIRQLNNKLKFLDFSSPGLNMLRSLIFNLLINYYLIVLTMDTVVSESLKINKFLVKCLSFIIMKNATNML